MLYLKLNYCFFIKKRVFFEGAWASGGRGRGRGWKKPAAYNSKTIDRARNNGRSTDNVRTDLGVDRSTFRLAGHVDRSHLIVLKMK